MAIGILKAVGLLVGVAAGLLVLGCARAPEEGEAEPPAAVDLEARAAELAREFLIVDTHIDVPYRLRERMEDISVRTETGDFDYPRARAGGLDAAFMSIYIPASYQKTGGAGKVADDLIGMVEKFETDWPDKFAVARSTADVRAHKTAGLLSLPLGMENGAPIAKLADLGRYHGRGIRYITLTHSENNRICDSSYAKEKQWNGLSPFGREVVAEMNRLGIIIDVSHVSDAAFWQVMELSRAPVLATHSSCRALTPGWERNMDDDMIRRLGENGGVLQINFGSGFLRQDARQQSETFWAERRAYLEEKKLDSDSPEAKAFRQAWYEKSPQIYATLDDVVAHVDHTVELAGIDHVGIGSDYDGVGDSLPVGLKDVSQYPNLIRALLEAGYSEDDVRKLCGENTMRVWAEVERIAGELQAAG